MEKIEITSRPRATVSGVADFLHPDRITSIMNYHRSFPVYRETPLVRLTHTARALGIKDIYVKDESFRFGLNAFKVLGGSWAIGSLLAEKLGLNPEKVTFSDLVSPEAREKLGTMTFITATDGNHGRGVAWTATQLGHKSVVYMPKGSASERLDNIRLAGADAYITDMNYDDTVRLARRKAEENGWITVQDTSWPGYTHIPERIMQGYCAMGMEAYEQLEEKPTHIFLQAGVGSMAAAMAGFFAGVWKEERPTVVVVEPNRADCLFRTAKAGKLTNVSGNMDTIMAGLACGEPNPQAWEILSETADFFLSCPDYTAALGMRMLGNPAFGDDRVISGESGASCFGCAAEILMNQNCLHIRDALGLGKDSVLLFFSTEGATFLSNYRKIVWEGGYPCPQERQSGKL